MMGDVLKQYGDVTITPRSSVVSVLFALCFSAQSSREPLTTTEPEQDRQHDHSAEGLGENTVGTALNDAVNCLIERDQ